ncbi:Concanavalin A-like lectin/glucanases superfamily [uncultured Caudovirales phage]|uniref:Concanavalin A-like lectin/glucanases superfamily n=1 Tax=uncultured Caudovirales phage TaxID=2100421 RepID=A0A6J7WRK3_9CAUD|nr:Concanavalin A-like lectin/glucanases superfamily [uncultured Caudovirales phage]
MNRYTGGVISATAPSVSQSSASGVWNLEEAQYYQKAGLWPPGSGSDPYFQNTALLLHGDGTNGAQNNTFLDSSVYNATITRNGNPTQGSSTPYVGPGCWSNYFPGSSCGFSAPTSAIYSPGTGDFTVEGWFYLTRVANTDMPVIKLYASSTANYEIRVKSTGVMNYFLNNTAYAGITTIQPYTWYHVAYTRTGGVLRAYINGALDLTPTTNAASIGNVPAYIGTDQAQATFLNGYLSNLRVINGTSLYSGSSLTVPTSPLIAVPKTVLLACQTSGYQDISGANVTFTMYGTTNQVSKFAPFTFYQTSPANYSGYFDGTGDYVTLPTGTSLVLGTGDFTMEAWVYPTARVSAGIGGYILGQSSFGVGSDWAWAITPTGTLQFYMLTGGAGNLVTSTGTVPLGAWTHVAVVRSGSRFSLYINGSLDGTLTGSQLLTNTYTPATIANSSNNTGSVYFAGSISNLRVTKGVAVYTTNFTPAMAALTSTTTVSSSASNSVSFDGSGDYLTVPSNAALNILSGGNFTIEAWVYLSATPTGSGAVIVQSSSVSNGYVFRVNPTLVVNWVIPGVAGYAFGPTLSLNTWYHVALCRVGTTATGYVNGTQYTFTSTDRTTDASQPTAIGGDNFNSSSYLTGFVSNLRITKGQALYTSAFTPSTTPLTTTSQGATAANVSLLTCQNNLLQDNSTNLFAVTPNGDAKPTSMNPFVSTNGIGGTSYSGYFSGSGQLLTVPTSAGLNLGAGDFTMEGWVYLASAQTSKYLFGVGTLDGTTRSAAVWIGGTQKIEGYFSADGSTWLSYRVGTTTVAANQWVHVAFVRSGTTLYLFLNGVLEGTQTGTPTTAASGYPAYIGGQTAAYQINGYLSNIRIVKGTAVYTASFSPPTAPLTAITNTQLLTCQNTTFIDNSTNAFTITNTGTTLTDTLNPFSGSTKLLTCQSTTFIDNSATPYTLSAFGNAAPRRANPFTDTVTGPTAYTAITYGGSSYFDGSGDYLSLADAPTFEPGGSDFTVECWFYMNGANPTNGAVFFSKANTSSYGPITVGFSPTASGSQLTALSSSTGSTWGVTTIATGTYATATALRNSWNHVAYVRSGNVFTLYLNGVIVSTVTNAITLIDNTELVRIGSSNFASADFPGYICNLRYVIGSAVYTGPFVPPTTPVTAIANTRLLVNGTNAGIFDNTTINNLETAGSAQVSTSVVKYGTGSISYPSLGSYLTFKGGVGTFNGAAIAGSGILFTGNTFTVEAWINPITKVSTASYYSTIIADASATSGALMYWAIGLSSTGAPIVAWYDGALKTCTGGSTIANNTWTHLAFVSTAGVLKIYVNGVSETLSGTTTLTTPSGSTGALVSGVDRQQYWTGNLDDVRVTNGVARYTANFTPPQSAFPNF